MKNRISLLNSTIIVLVLTAIQSVAQSTYEPYTFTTLAGLGSGLGSADGTGSAARFRSPLGVAVDSAGNVYVADQYNHTIRKVTPAGAVTTLAGNASITDEFGPVGAYLDGTGSAARFSYPSGVAVDSAGNAYVADFNGIRKVTSAGVVTTLAGLRGSAVAVDTAGGLYLASGYSIQKATLDGTNWVVTTLAGGANPGSADGTGNDARFSEPFGVVVDRVGNVYVADLGNSTIRKVTPAGVVTTLAGGFYYPRGVVVDSAGNVYVADTYNNTIRKVTPAGVVTTLAGLAQCCDDNGNPVGGSADGTGSAAQFDHPSGVAVDSADNVYVTDSDNNTIRKVTPTGVVTTLAGLGGPPGSADGTGSNARFDYGGLTGVAVDSAGNVYVADTGNNAIRKVTQAGVVTTLAGLGGSAVVVDSAGNLYLIVGNSIEKATLVGINWVVTTLAGLAGSFGSADGTGSDARFGGGRFMDGPFRVPTGLAVDSAGNVYVADTFNHTIRKVTPAGVVTTLAGLAGADPGNVDGTGSAARFYDPVGVAVDSAGNVYVADSGYNTIRKVSPSAVVTTLAGAGFGGSADGTGRDARFNSPFGVAVDSAANVYVTDSGIPFGSGFNHTIRKVTPAGVVTTLAGLAGEYGSADGTGRDARFFFPSGVAVDSAGNVYVADTGNTIRKGYPALMILNSRPGIGFNGGQFGFNLTGPMGRSVVLEGSTDLVSWLPLWTNTFVGALNFSDPQSGVSPIRFYRAHTR